MTLAPYRRKPGSASGVARRRRARYAALGLAGCIVAISLSVLLGWMIHVPALTSWGGVSAVSKPITAIGLLTAAAGTALTAFAGSNSGRRYLRAWSRAAGVATAFIGIVCLAMRIAAPDRLNNSSEADVWPILRSPSWATAVSFLAAGMNLSVMRGRSTLRVVIRQIGASSVGMIGGIAALGYILGVSELFDSVFFQTLAYPSVTEFLFLAAALNLARPEEALVALLLRDDAGGSVSRRLLPVVTLLPILLGLAMNAAVLHGNLGPQLGLAVFIVMVTVAGCIATSVTALSLGKSDLHRRSSERRVRVMLSELDHRVKNTMAAVLSVCEQTASRSKSLDEFRRTFRGRLQAMARAHDILAANRWRNVSLLQIIQTVVGAYTVLDPHLLELDGEDVQLPSSAALGLAVTLNELATNAVKHGAWSSVASEGRVRLAWRISPNNELAIDWIEIGVRTPIALREGGFGLELIRGMIPHDLGGSVDVVAAAVGIHCTIRLVIKSTNDQATEPLAVPAH